MGQGIETDVDEDKILKERITEVLKKQSKDIFNDSIALLKQELKDERKEREKSKYFANTLLVLLSVVFGVLSTLGTLLMSNSIILTDTKLALRDKEIEILPITFVELA